MKKKSKKKKQDIAKVNPELEELDIRINQFGEKLDELGKSVFKEILEGKFKRMPGA